MIYFSAEAQWSLKPYPESSGEKTNNSKVNLENYVENSFGLCHHIITIVWQQKISRRVATSTTHQRNMGRVLLIHFLPAVCWCIRPREKNSGVANIHGKAQEHARRVKERERERQLVIYLATTMSYNWKIRYSIFLHVIHITTIDLKLMILDFTIVSP